MMVRISAVAALLAASGSSAFRPSFSLSPAARPTFDAARQASGPATSSSSELFMSTIPDDEDEYKAIPTALPPLVDPRDQFRFKQPPAPEDSIAIGGDLLAIFVYSYLDHIANDIYAKASAEIDVADLVVNNPDSMASLPVWFDASHLQTFGANWLQVASIQSPYAPAIAVPGLAFVAMSTAWLLSGYLSGAFLSRNTVECPPERALATALKTWALTSLLMVALAWGSDYAWGALDDHVNALSAPARGGLTQADADFIFDSLSVLAFWRFMYNWLLGYRR